MRNTENRLQSITGILALIFGIYCLIIGIGMTVFGLPEMNVFLLISCVIFSIIYTLYGIILLLAQARKNHMNSFIGIGIIITFWLPGNFNWYVWPMIIMPFVILILSLILIQRQFSGRTRRWK